MQNEDPAKAIYKKATFNGVVWEGLEEFSKEQLLQYLYRFIEIAEYEREWRLSNAAEMERNQIIAVIEAQRHHSREITRMTDVWKQAEPNITKIIEDYKAILQRGDVPVSEAMWLELRRLQESVTNLQGIGRSSEKYRYPLLSEVKDTFINFKKKQLNPDGSHNRYTHYAIPAAIDVWMSIIGDKPLDHYRASDLTLFGSTLSRVPANWQKIRELKGKTLQEAADYNTALKKKALPTLKADSILRGYSIPIRECIDWLCEQEKDHPLASPFVHAKVRKPREAQRGEDRESFTVEQLSALLRLSGKQAHKVDKWLPLLAFLTGCRLGELVMIQAEDIRLHGGCWAIDLREEVLHTGERRRRKNQQALRLVACHHMLEETGFIEWATNRSGFVFDAFVKTTKNPESAASKRLNRLIRSAGIDDSKVTFHSLRHTTKDWLRKNDIDPREIDLQCGHSHKTVGQRYGKKSLRPEDLPAFRDMSLPVGLDVSTYKKSTK